MSIERQIKRELDTFNTYGAIFFRNQSRASLSEAALICIQKRIDEQNALTLSPKSIKLYTMMKSGTNYFKLILANYVYFLGKDTAEGLDYNTMVKSFLPYDPVGHEESRGFLNKIGYESFFYRHGSHMIDRAAYPTIRLHRNPLDFIVSWFFYRYKSRGDNTFIEAKDSVESSATSYSRHVGRWYTGPKQNEHLSLHYEELVTAPFDTFIRVLTYLKAPIDESALRKAIEASSFDRVRANEVNNGAIHGAVGQLHTRSGKIGEWQEHLDDKDVKLVQSILEKHGLLLDDFMTKPEQAVKVVRPKNGVIQRIRSGLRTTIQRIIVPKA